MPKIANASRESKFMHRISPRSVARLQPPLSLLHIELTAPLRGEIFADWLPKSTIPPHCTARAYLGNRSPLEALTPPFIVVSNGATVKRMAAFWATSSLSVECSFLVGVSKSLATEEGFARVPLAVTPIHPLCLSLLSVGSNRKGPLPHTRGD